MILRRDYVTKWDCFKLKVKRKIVSFRYWMARKLLPENQWAFLEKPTRQPKTYLLDESKFCSRDTFMELGARKIKKSLVVDMIDDLVGYTKMDVLKAEGDDMVECRAVLRILR